MKPCLICQRIAQITQNENPYFVREFSTGYVVIGDHQRFAGYTLFLCKQHVHELHELEPAFRLQFLHELSQVSEAVHRAFAPEKLNIEQLGNGDAHLHWHIFPRRAGDTPQPGPVWWLPKEEMYADAARPDAAKLEELKTKLQDALQAVAAEQGG
ncbi:MAG: HIT family protein [Oscillospiraceae bacterium]|jgi:diadenosine tetraphosphate (Ap4A) HIT family hydrolase|nr:HIT family protein [Oscillospiraceae bacterium]